MRAHTCKSKHALVFTRYVAERFSNGSSGVDVYNLGYTTIAAVLYFMYFYSPSQQLLLPGVYLNPENPGNLCRKAPNVFQIPCKC